MNPRPPHLVIFLQDLGGGGAERMILANAASYREAGWRITLVLCRRRGALVSAVPAGIRIIDLRHSRMVLALPALALTLRRLDPDIILSTLVQANALVCLARCAVPRAVVVLREANNPDPSVGHDNALVRLAYRWLPWFYASADLVVAVSEGVAGALIARGCPASRTRAVPNPAHDPRRAAAATAVPAPHPWLDDPAMPVVLAVGRLSHEKGHGLLIDAVAALAARRPLRLLVMGAGPEADHLRRQAHERGLGERFAIVPFQADPLPAMARATMVALPSVFEGCPNVLIEALGVGTAVVASDCPYGPAEILDHGRHGRLVPIGDVGALTRAIEQSLDDPIGSPETRRNRAKRWSLRTSGWLWRAALLRAVVRRRWSDRA